MGENVIVCGNSGNGDSGSVTTERGVDDDDDKCATNVALAAEFNESEPNGTVGTGERDGNAVLDNRMDSKEEEKDEGNDGVVLCETSAIRHSDQVYFPLSMLYLIALEKGKMVTMMKSQKGEFGNTSMVKSAPVAGQF